jgi:hypothetical protein
MPATLTKRRKKAAELADLVRRSVNKPELRVAVFATTRGWRAKVYSETGEDVTRLQALVDEKAAILGEQYELSD